MENSLVHQVGDVTALAHHISMLYKDRTLLEKFRTAGLRAVPEITWNAAGIKLLDAYRNCIELYHGGGSENSDSPISDSLAQLIK